MISFYKAYKICWWDPVVVLKVYFVSWKQTPKQTKKPQQLNFQYKGLYFLIFGFRWRFPETKVCAKISLVSVSDTSSYVHVPVFLLGGVYKGARKKGMGWCLYYVLLADTNACSHHLHDNS